MKQIVLARGFVGASAALLLGIAFVNCSGNTPDSIGGGGNVNPGGGNGAGLTTSVTLPDASLGGGGNGGTGATPTADANCGVKTSGATKAPVDVLLVLDRSGSMAESIGDECCCDNACSQSTAIKLCSTTTGCTQRWPALTSAVNTTISKTTEINWGLKFFSTPPAGGRQSDSCAVSAGVDVPIAAAATAAAQIQTKIAATTPGASTPTAKALTTASAYFQTVKDSNNKVILLASDGQPNCMAGNRDTAAPDLDGTKKAAADALAAGYKVYVIGIGPSANVANLDSFAVAGGTDHYYPATSADDLAQALLSISQAVASCTFTMDQAPPEPNNIAVYVGTQAINKDAANGWSYGSSSQTVNFNGTTCELIKSGKGGEVKVMFGCGGSPPPPLF